jgi:hypothetical protein
MSILSELQDKKITFSQAAAQLLGWGEKVVAADPALTAVVGDVISGLKQAASNAVAIADTAFVAFIGPATKGLELALDTALAGYTHGISSPFNPVINDTIDKIEAAAVAEANAWALKAKASWGGQKPS